MLPFSIIDSTQRVMVRFFSNTCTQQAEFDVSKKAIYLCVPHAWSFACELECA